METNERDYKGAVVNGFLGLLINLLILAAAPLCIVSAVNGYIPEVLGIVVGIIGLVGCSVNYPIYKKMLERGKEKYAYEIVELARQISESE